MAEVQLPKLPEEKAHRMAIRSLGEQCDALTLALVNKFGSEEAQKLIYPYLFKMGKQAASAMPRWGVAGKDALAIAAWMDFVEEQLLKVEGKFTEASPERVVKEITRCPLQHLSVDFCKSFESIAEGVCEGVNPQYRYRLTKIIPAGDSVCEWVVEKK